MSERNHRMSDDRYFSPAATHLRVLELQSRIDELQAAIAELTLIAEPLLRRERATAKKAEYMRDYMRKKRERETDAASAAV